MTRTEQLGKRMRMRKGLRTAVIAVDERGRRYTQTTKDHDSINQAKRANGKDAIALRRDEHFPPLLVALPMLEEVAAV